MGEAAKNIPTATRYKYPDIAWKEMAGMRDKLIHGYSGVDSHKVWLVVQDYLCASKGSSSRYSRISRVNTLSLLPLKKMLDDIAFDRLPPNLDADVVFGSLPFERETVPGPT